MPSSPERPVDPSLGIQAPAECIREELARILASADFAATPRRREMLRYLVEETIAGRSHALKGYTIGVAVFGRTKDFDPQADPIVRLEARRLRRDLDSYYVEAGRANPHRISIPKGQYVPEVAPIVSGATAEAMATAASDALHDRPEDGAGSTAQPVEPTAARRTTAWAIALVAAGLMLLAGLAYPHLKTPQGIQNSARQIQAPGLAVVPLEALGDNPHGAFLAAGITEQILSDLGRFPDLRLFLSASGAESGGGEPSADRADRLGIGYILAGKVGADDTAIRITTRLADAKTRQILWTATYDRPISAASLLAVQAEIAADVASALGQPYGVIQSEVTNRLARSFVPTMSSYECVVRAYSYRRSFARDQHAPVLACLEATVERDPEYAEAWAMLGWLSLDAARFGWTGDSNTELAYNRALGAGSRAVALDGSNALALKALSSTYHYMGNFEESERLQRRAVELNPYDPDALAQLGWRLAVRGRFEEGIPYLQRAIERTINPPGWYHHLIAIDHYMQGRYRNMLATARTSVVDGSGISWSLIAIAEGELGNEAAAREALAKMAEVSPLLGRDPAAAYRRHQATDAIVDALVSGLRKAGWAEPAVRDDGL